MHVLLVHLLHIIYFPYRNSIFISNLVQFLCLTKYIQLKQLKNNGFSFLCIVSLNVLKDKRRKIKLCGGGGQHYLVLNKILTL